jgi:hypothetical protein
MDKIILLPFIISAIEFRMVTNYFEKILGRLRPSSLPARILSSAIASARPLQNKGLVNEGSMTVSGNVKGYLNR